MRARVAVLSAAAVIGALTTSPSSAQSLAEFYRRHPLVINVGYPPGGGYDLYARTVARHLGRHIPGTPSVVTQTMPGAGSLKAANHLYSVAPKDGTTLAVFSRGIAFEPLLGNTSATFDPLRFNWIGSTSTEVSFVFAWHTTPFKTYRDLQTRPMIVASSAAGAEGVTFAVLIEELLHAKFKLVMGYAGSADILLAIERGEAEGTTGFSWGALKSTKPDWIQDRKVNVLLQYSPTKHPDLSDVPLASDLLESDADRRLLELFNARTDMAWPFAAPPDVPLDRVRALREGFDETMKDQQFLADAERQMLEIQAVKGSEIEALVRRVYASPSTVIARARVIYQRSAEAR